MKPEYLKEVLEKFAISGAMYSRALSGAAQRGGGRVAPQILSQVAAQPRAQASSFLSQQARAPGAMAPTPRQQQNQTVMNIVPWAGPEHGGVPTARATMDRMFAATGRTQRQPGVEQAIKAQHGDLFDFYAAERAQKQRAMTHGQTFAAPNQQQFLAQQGLALPGGRTQVSAPPQGVVPQAFEPTIAQSTVEKTNPGIRRKAANFGEFARKAAPWAIGLGIPLATTGGLLLSKPGVQASLKDKLQRPESTQQKDLHAAVPEAMLPIAQRAQQAMVERGYDPATLRIAVDAPPGAGKSSLAHALVNQMGVKHYGLDWLPAEQQELSGGHLEKMPRAPRAGEVLEHHNLLRTHDPELFDAAFYIAKDPEQIKQQIIQRGRSAGMADFYDYPKTIGVGHLAFDTLAGDPVDLGDGVFMKLRPREGWGADTLDKTLVAKGIDPAGLTRHEKLLSLYGGKRTTGHGWIPYAKSPFTPGETALAASSVPLGIGAALAAAKFLR